jgi:hypothetical protein
LERPDPDDPCLARVTRIDEVFAKQTPQSPGTVIVLAAAANDLRFHIMVVGLRLIIALSVNGRGLVGQ